MKLFFKKKFILSGQYKTSTYSLINQLVYVSKYRQLIGGKLIFKIGLDRSENRLWNPYWFQQVYKGVVISVIQANQTWETESWGSDELTSWPLSLLTLDWLFTVECAIPGLEGKSDTVISFRLSFHVAGGLWGMCFACTSCHGIEGQIEKVTNG